MDATLIKKIMQFALASAGDNEDWKDRELGPIHLIKYVYLADLAHAERTGKTLTGAPWRFYYFGPYCTEVWQEAAPAMAAIMAEDRSFPSDFGADDVRRWRSKNPSQEQERLGAELPIHAQGAVKRAVRQWGSDTQGLLHFVYNTGPMLRAAPNEPLNFEMATPTAKFESEPTITKRQEKQRREKLDAFRLKLEELRAGRQPPSSSPMREPRYDDVYEEGVAWLDRLAGGPLAEHRGTMEIDDSVWHSETRGDRGDS